MLIRNEKQFPPYLHILQVPGTLIIISRNRNLAVHCSLVADKSYKFSIYGKVLEFSGGGAVIKLSFEKFQNYRVLEISNNK